MRNTTTALDHEDYIQAVRRMAVAGATTRGTITEAEAQRLDHTKLIYGVGQAGVRGTCYFETWQNGIGMVDTVEIAAAGQENWIQLTGTTLHELAHVLAGHKAGHGKDWKQAAVRLGFTKEPAAAGQVYHLAMIDARLREQASGLAHLMADGTPAFGGAARGSWLATLLGGNGSTIRPCSAGHGTRGGTSRGAGSGSRMRLYVCGHGQKVRAATDSLNATCDECGTKFARAAK